MISLKKITFVSLLVISLNLVSQNFTWKRGSCLRDYTGNHGIKGTASQGNNPGARRGAMTWTDGSGKLWLFGGFGWDQANNLNELNDLWKYDPITNQWAWMSGDSIAGQNGVYGIQGQAAISNKPGARSDGVTWIDASGNLWLFGGNGFDKTSAYPNFLNDVWKYTVANNRWTWVGGTDTVLQTPNYGLKSFGAASNDPGARAGSANWQDPAGDLWLFGGKVYSGFLNDFWKYNVATNQWTWLAGDSLLNQGGSYSSAPLFPGAHSFSSYWKDPAGDFWMFGGGGFTPTVTAWDVLSDLWKYEPSTDTWFFVNGSTQGSRPGVYGGNGTIYTHPGARTGGPGWTDAAGLLWLFGGEGRDMNSTYGFLNDVWRYDQNSGIWTSTKVNYTVNLLGKFGPLGITSNTVIPGSRLSGAVWTDAATNTAWMMGGYGKDSAGTIGYLSDLWLIETCPATPTSTNMALCDHAVTGVLKYSISQADFSVYPNPSNGQFTLNLGTFEEKTKLCLYDISGRKVMESTMTEKENVIRTQLSNGVYSYEIYQSARLVGSGKLVIQNE